MDAADPPQYELSSLFIGRLRHLLELERSAGEGVDEVSRLLVHKAIFSTWLDCLELGARDEASQLMHLIRRPSGRAA